MAEQLFAFPKIARLLTKAEFQHVFRHGQKLSRPDFSIRYSLSPTASPRLGLAFLKKKSSARSIATSSNV